MLSVDIPSGVAGATGAVPGPAVAAERTVTFAAPKVGLVQYPGAGLAGSVEVADIGIPDRLIEEEAEMEEFGYAQRTGVRGGIGPEERSRIADGQYVKKVRRGQN